jgi:hypothetical protein
VGGRADVRERVRISKRGSMGVHGCSVIPLLAKIEPVVGLEDREREHAEAAAGAALTGVEAQSARRSTTLKPEPERMTREIAYCTSGMR